MQHIDFQAAKDYIHKTFDQSALSSLIEYIKIPNLSRDFDPEYATNGLLEKAAQHIASWIRSLNLKNSTVEIIKHEGYTPIIFTEVKGQLPETVFYYGHYDKQPPFVGWKEGYGPTTPVIEGGKLYGRGGADDGYSTYSTMLSIKAMQLQGIKMPRCVMITEGDEESGGHIDYYLPALKEKIGNPSIFMCLDSGTCDYETFSLTTSLRGVTSCLLTVEVTKEGVHSGDASGIIPSSFRIIRRLISRLENEETGQMHPAFHDAIPPNRYKEIYDFATQKASAVKVFPFLPGVEQVSPDPLISLVNRGWKPQLEVTGADGFPLAQTAGNVLRPKTTLKLSIRLPPTKGQAEVQKALVQLLTKDPPYNAKVTIENLNSAKGWSCPPLENYLESAIDESALKYFGTRRHNISEGGTIPMMNLLQQLWPKGQFLVTGVLGPESNAHGPNEFLHLDYTKKITCCMAHILGRVSQHLAKQ